MSTPVPVVAESTSSNAEGLEPLSANSRHHVLLDAVERLGERVRLLLGPVVREALIRRAAGQQGPRARHVCAHLLLHGRVLALVRPAAVLEAAAAVLLGVPRCLHYAVKRQVLDDDKLAQAVPPFADSRATGTILGPRISRRRPPKRETPTHRNHPTLRGSRALWLSGQCVTAYR